MAAIGCLPLFLSIGIGVAFPASGIFARAVLGARTGRHEVALTFDDGPDPKWTPILLDLLDTKGQKATFFVVGERASRHAALLQDIVRRGHEIANHTWSHSYLTVFRSPRVLARELERTNALIAAETGIRPRWFRPPVGLLSPRVAIGVRLAGLRLAGWTASARDGVERTTVSQAISRLQGALAPGAILVLHDARIAGTAEPIACAVVSALLNRMQTLGLRSVTLSELCAPTGTAR